MLLATLEKQARVGLFDSDSNVIWLSLDPHYIPYGQPLSRGNTDQTENVSTRNSTSNAWTLTEAAAASEAAVEYSAELEDDLIGHIKTVACAQQGEKEDIMHSTTVHSPPPQCQWRQRKRLKHSYGRRLTNKKWNTSEKSAASQTGKGEFQRTCWSAVHWAVRGGGRGAPERTTALS